ncbi:MAG TPA: transporter substrate-binding protein, partial [Chloroflexota bacterium]|nr:transporter substrate-binding protein [Chloroflexota bacterium]
MEQIKGAPKGTMVPVSARGITRKRFLGGLIGGLAGTGLLAACGPESGPASSGGASSAPSGDTIKVGILHSLSGTMAISETSVRDATLLAIEEINKAGGVLKKKLVPVIEDGASDWPTF